MTTFYYDELPEYALTKEQILAKRAADRGPNAPKPAALIIERDAGKTTPTSLHLHVLGSGSKGNCVVVEGPEGSVMIDCGFSKRETFARMERAKIDPSSIRAIIITHEHSDHIAGLGVVSRALRAPVYASIGTVDSKKKISDIENVHAFRAREALELAGIHIITFPTSHDAADPIGMRFECGNDVIGYATDTGILSMESFEMLMDCRILALESNHDPEMLRTGPYPYPLKKRVASDFGHLSNAQSGIGLTKLLCNDLECVIGMHLSETNNLPTLALGSLQTAVAQQGHPAHVAIAAQSRPISIL